MEFKAYQCEITKEEALTSSVLYMTDIAVLRLTHNNDILLSTTYLLYHKSLKLTQLLHNVPFVGRCYIRAKSCTEMKIVSIHSLEDRDWQTFSTVGRI